MSGYNIKRSDLINPSDIHVPDNQTGSLPDLSIGLVGRNFSSYATAISTTQLHMLENFAAEVAPLNSITGQLWYDKSAGQMKFGSTDSTDATPGTWETMIHSGMDGEGLTLGNLDSPFDEIYGTDIYAGSITSVVPGESIIFNTDILYGKLPAGETNLLCAVDDSETFLVKAIDITNSNELIAYLSVVSNADGTMNTKWKARGQYPATIELSNNDTNDDPQIKLGVGISGDINVTGSDITLTNLGIDIKGDITLSGNNDGTDLNKIIVPTGEDEEDRLIEWKVDDEVVAFISGGRDSGGEEKTGITIQTKFLNDDDDDGSTYDNGFKLYDEYDKFNYGDYGYARMWHIDNKIEVQKDIIYIDGLLGDITFGVNPNTDDLTQIIFQHDGAVSHDQSTIVWKDKDDNVVSSIGSWDIGDYISQRQAQWILFYDDENGDSANGGLAFRNNYNSDPDATYARLWMGDNAIEINSELGVLLDSDLIFGEPDTNDPARKIIFYDDLDATNDNRNIVWNENSGAIDISSISVFEDSNTGTRKAEGKWEFKTGGFYNPMEIGFERRINDPTAPDTAYYGEIILNNNQKRIIIDPDDINILSSNDRGITVNNIGTRVHRNLYMGFEDLNQGNNGDIVFRTNGNYNVNNGLRWEYPTGGINYGLARLKSYGSLWNNDLRRNSEWICGDFDLPQQSYIKLQADEDSAYIDLNVTETNDTGDNNRTFGIRVGHNPVHGFIVIGEYPAIIEMYEGSNSITIASTKYPVTRPENGQVLAAVNDTGTLGWVDIGNETVPDHNHTTADITDIASSYALKNGNSNETFAVADAAANNEAASLGQVQSLAGLKEIDSIIWSSDGIYTGIAPTPGTKLISITVIGGGGGGAGAWAKSGPSEPQVYTGGGGSAGNYVSGIFNADDSTVFTVTVGSGGDGGKTISGETEPSIIQRRGLPGNPSSVISTAGPSITIFAGGGGGAGQGTEASANVNGSKTGTSGKGSDGTIATASAKGGGGGGPAGDAKLNVGGAGGGGDGGDGFGTGGNGSNSGGGGGAGGPASNFDTAGGKGGSGYCKVIYFGY